MSVDVHQPQLRAMTIPRLNACLIAYTSTESHKVRSKRVVAVLMSRDQNVPLPKVENAFKIVFF